MRVFGDVLLRGQAELAGRLTQLGEYSAREQNKIATAINEQKLAVLKIMDEKLLAVTKNQKRRRGAAAKYRKNCGDVDGLA